MDKTIILCGFGQVGRRVLDCLHAAKVPVVIIDLQAASLSMNLENVRFIQGDFREKAVLQEAGIEHARGVLVLTSNDLVNISTALMVRHLRPDVRVVVRLFNQGLIPRLGKAVANVVALSVSGLTAPLLAATAITGQALGTFKVEEGHYQITELVFQQGSEWVGRSIGELSSRYRVLVVADLPAKGVDRVLLDVDQSRRVTFGDHLVVCGEPDDVAALLSGVGDEALPQLRWAGKVRRFSRVAWRTLKEVDHAVKVCTGVLVGVVIASTLVYHLGMEKPVPVSIYRTVSVMATGSSMHGEELSHWQQIFVSGLRIIGAVLIAAFTAIFTNYLLRARLSGALEAHRIPDSGHIIVCGLGNIGYRVVEELLDAGQRVVIIEQKRDSRFMAAVRRLDVAIMVGDASVLEVLRQAHAASARAVVAATSQELANLEIGLLARELNPHQRVVIRLRDPNLAQTLREAANIRFAVAIPTLAAPAFVAALIGDRIQSVFMVKGRLLAAMELVVQANDTFNGQKVGTLAVNYRLLPVHLSGHNPPLSQISEYQLKNGDRLIVAAALADLDHLLNRERVDTDGALPTKNFARSV